MRMKMWEWRRRKSSEVICKHERVYHFLPAVQLQIIRLWISRVLKNTSHDLMTAYIANYIS